ncbi:MAG: UvrD-helicase domain-containing protein [Leptospira sp.]|nr:UvrD-helicase domain-containing protein [Leptospira sp.]
MNNSNYPLRHHFIEASAGTGKTYTIMEIVSHLIQDEEHPLDLKKTLILTFTEKAAGELKERLRKKLEESSVEKIREKVHELDEVMVATIHGFCKSILEEYPIETGYSDLAVFKDGPTRGAEALYQLEHKEWNGHWGEELTMRLRTSDYFGEKDKLVTTSITKLLSGREYGTPNLLQQGKKINPESITINKTKVDLFFSTINRIENLALESILPSINGNKKPTIYKFKKSFHFFKELNSIYENEKSLNEFKAKFIIFLIKNDFFNPSIDFEKEYLKNNKIPLNDLELFIKSKDIINELYEEIFGEICELYSPEFFLQSTALQAVNIANSDREEEWISFDAMISRLAESLVENPILLESLRKRFDVGIIDEFQDTDSLQYSIFRKIFLEGDDGNTNRALYLIGDPKQSIYGFRGADIGTYLQAKKDISEKLPGQSIGFSLETNYRSVENLIHGYNEIFQSEHFLANVTEAGFESIPIQYKPVSPPTADNRNYDLDPDYSDPPIQVVDLSGDTKQSIDPIRENWNEFIVQEIQKLMNDEFQYKKKTKDKDGIEKLSPVSLKFNDIAILVNSKNAGHSLLELCKQAGIPATYYQQEGIYQSREVDQILTILNCLQDSHNPSSFRKILLTDAFRVHPRDLSLFDEHSIDSYEKTLLNRWRISAHKRNFADLFRSIEQDSKIFFQEGNFDLAWERKSTNYRQIFRKLLEISQTGKPTLDEIILELKKLKKISKLQEEKATFEKETESSAVQILTVHASKGLEWPIVFLHSMAGERNTRHEFYDYPTVSTIDGLKKRVWKISLWEKDNQAFDAYEENEAKRRFYVAITRPKVRLYLPQINPSKPNSYSRIVSSALSEIEARIRNGERELETYFQFRNLNTEREEWGKSKAKSSIHPSQSNKDDTVPNKILKKTHADSSYSPLNLVYTNRKPKPAIRITSYSGLKDWDSGDMGITLSGYGRTGVISTELEPTNKEGEEPHEEESPIETLIQPSSFAGNYLHNILEDLSFGKFANHSQEELIKDPELRDIIFQWMDYFAIDRTKTARNYQGEIPVRDAILKETVHILWNTMHANIPLQEKSIHLKDLEDSATVREMSFHWNSLFSSTPDMKEFLTTQLIKGSIDLVFESDAKFYLADYKSNAIDKDADIIKKVEKDETSRYDLQRDIYSYAFFQYLKQCYEDENTALDKFGGIYYFFLRVMEEEKESGIYIDKDEWTLGRFQKIEERIQRVLDNWRNNHDI